MSNAPTTSEPTKASRAKKNRSIPLRIFDFLSGYGLCVSTLFILGLIVWLSTIEQTETGLAAASKKYYDSSAIYIIPTLENGEGIPRDLPIILPGAYWTCAVLFINMLLGGIVRIRKNAKQIGPIISHLGILLLLVAGFVDHHQSIHGRMDVRTFGTYDYAWKQNAPTLEIFSYDKEQKKTKPFVIKTELLEDLADDGENPKMRTFTFKDLPFDIEVRNYYPNAVVLDATKYKREKKSGKEIDGFFLHPIEVDPKNDHYSYSCYVTVKPKDGSPDIQLLLSREIPHPVTFTLGETIYGVEMPNEIWLMPYEIKLVNSVGEYYPGTKRPSKFSSTIEWHSKENEYNKTSLIEMNKPLRYEGYTLYQAHWEEPTDGIEYSGFEIVTNPSDRWPIICLLISATGLLIHFGVKLVEYLTKQRRKVAK